jgi:hypothetical protein
MLVPSNPSYFALEQNFSLLSFAYEIFLFLQIWLISKEMHTKNY